MTTATARLASVPLFAGLRRSQRKAIDRLGAWIDLDDGRVLCREGEPGDEFFLIVQGTVGAQSSTGLVSILRAGEWFGEVSLITGSARCATVTTFTPATVIVFDRREFAELLRIAPSVKARLERSAARLAQPSPSTAPPNDRPLVTRPSGAGTRA
jgi:CRP-like cAMP-binding protein